MSVGPSRKPLIWLYGEIKTPPLSKGARVETGTWLRLLQEGESVGMPHTRPMPSIGPRCHELRIRDENRIWRIVYRLDPDRILIAGVFAKTTRKTAGHDIQDCKRRLKLYDRVSKELEQ
jgi:phage-related protein